MKVVKPNALGVLSRCYENGGQAYFSVAALVFFAIGEHTRILGEQELWKTVPAELGDEPLDLSMPKVRGEVLVNGKAFPPGGPRPVCSVRVRLGRVDKTLWVVGNRKWRRGMASDPTPFTEMPITWARAFGGPGFAKNPVGRGAAPVVDDESSPASLADVRGGKLQRLPNIEDPKALVKSPSDRPEPVGLAGIDFAWPQRAVKAGTYDAKWQKERYPGFPEDMDWTIFQSAPDDQQCDGFFAGDETFSLENMHPSKPLLQGALPRVKVRMFVRFKGKPDVVEVATRIDTVRLFPHLERGVVVARGLVKVAEDDAHDVEHLMLAVEAMGTEKPASHYERVLASRLDKEKGHLAALRESDLMPPREPAAKRDRPAGAERIPEGRLRKRLRAKQERTRSELVERLTKLGIEGAAAAVPEIPPDPPPPDTDDLGALAEDALKKAEEASADAEKKKEEAEATARASFAARGLDYDAEMKKAMDEAAGPPKFSADAEIAKLVTMLEAARQAGLPAPELEAQLADQRTHESFRQHEVRLRDVYRRFAHELPAAARLDGDEAVRLREEVHASLRGRQSLAGRDFTGADLAGVDFAGADLRGAFFECANLAGAQLSGADLTGAVLCRADLSRANLFAAKLPGANLGGAKLVEAELGSADLERAVLAKADLGKATLRDALLEGANLHEAKLANADLSRARAPRALFFRAELLGAKLAHADLAGSVFLECVMTGADFAAAKMEKVSFVAVAGERATFVGAMLAKASFVKDCRLAGTSFRDAMLEEANLRGADLTGADLRQARLARADLSEARLHGASLARARAQGAQLVRADLTGADLAGIDLMEGSLAKACIAQADLTRANLFAVDFAKVRGDAATKLGGANVKRARVLGGRGVMS